MKTWQKTDSGFAEIKNINLTEPTVIVLGGGFNVDDPASGLNSSDKNLGAFFTFLSRYIQIDIEQFRHSICSNIDEKLYLNDFFVRKLLGQFNPEELPAVFAQNAIPIETTRKHVDILQITYARIENSFTRSYELIHNNQYFSEEAEHLVRIVFLPLLQRYTHVQTLCDALRNITFFCLSYGTVFVSEIENALLKLINQDAKWSLNADDILRSVAVVSVSNICDLPNTAKNGFITICLEGNNDALADWMNPRKITLSDLADNVAIKQIGERKLLLLSNVLTEFSSWIESSPYLDYSVSNADRVGHYSPYFLMRGIPYNLQPELAERALRNAVNRDGCITVHNLLKPSQPMCWKQSNKSTFDYLGESELISAKLNDAIVI